MSRRGYYLTNDEGKKERIPSVSSILKMFGDNEALLYWANNQGQEGKSLADARKVPLGAGSLTHAMIWDDIKGMLGEEREPLNLDDIDIQIVMNAKKAFQSYELWKGSVGFEPLYAEHPLTSKAMRFGGRPDLIAKVMNQVVLVDWKAAKGIYTNVYFQLAAYGMLIEENKEELEIESLGAVVPVRLGKEDATFDHLHRPWDSNTMRAAREGFTRLRSMYDIVKVLKS